MKRAGSALIAAVCAAAIYAGQAIAAPFKCPHVGGTFTFGQEANVNSLDMMTSSAISTRNIAMNVFETLVTRDENSRPIPELADSITESPDGLTYTFKLRQGVMFQNGKPMSSADVLASFERYQRVGLQRSTFDNIDPGAVTGSQPHGPPD
jgi:peptide/nickel transport system substrate-binding protein